MGEPLDEDGLLEEKIQYIWGIISKIDTELPQFDNFMNFYNNVGMSFRMTKTIKDQKKNMRHTHYMHGKPEIQ